MAKINRKKIDKIATEILNRCINGDENYVEVCKELNITTSMGRYCLAFFCKEHKLIIPKKGEQ